MILDNSCIPSFLFWFAEFFKEFLDLSKNFLFLRGISFFIRWGISWSFEKFSVSSRNFFFYSVRGFWFFEEFLFYSMWNFLILKKFKFFEIFRKNSLGFLTYLELVETVEQKHFWESFCFYSSKKILSSFYSLWNFLILRIILILFFNTFRFFSMNFFIKTSWNFLPGIFFVFWDIYHSSRISN